MDAIATISFGWRMRTTPSVQASGRDWTLPHFAKPSFRRRRPRDLVQAGCIAPTEESTVPCSWSGSFCLIHQERGFPEEGARAASPARCTIAPTEGSRVRHWDAALPAQGRRPGGCRGDPSVAPLARCGGGLCASAPSGKHLSKWRSGLARHGAAPGRGGRSRARASRFLSRRPDFRTNVRNERRLLRNDSLRVRLILRRGPARAWPAS
jgi:hypothetical protein